MGCDIFCLPGDDGESKGAHDDPLAIEHLEEKLHEEEEGDDVGVEEVGEEIDEKEMIKRKKKRTLMRNQT